MSANFYKGFISLGSLSRIRFFKTFSKLGGVDFYWLGPLWEAAELISAEKFTAPVPVAGR